MKQWCRWAKKVMILFCMLCLLAGCNKTEDDSEEKQAGTEQSIGDDSNKILWTNSLGTRTYGREGSFYSESNRIYFLDAATGAADIICDDAACQHKRNECSAYFDGITYVALEDDHLLVVTSADGNSGWDMRLYTADVNGSNRKLVAEFTTMMSIYQILFMEEKIIVSYWNNADENMEPMDENYAAIYVFDRKTNTGEVVWSKQALNAIAAKINYYNNVVYFDLLYFDVTLDELNEYGKYSDYVDDRRKYELCALDLEDNSITVIQDENWESFSVCGEKLWFSCEESLWSYHTVTGEKKQELEQNMRIEPVYNTDRLLVRDAKNYHTYYTYTPDGKLQENGTLNNVLTSVVYPEITWAMNYDMPTGNGEVIYWNTTDFFASGQNVQEDALTAALTSTQAPTVTPTELPTITPEPTQTLAVPEGTEVVTWVLPDTLLDERYYPAGVERLNQKLLSDGYHFILEFKSLPRANYRETVVSLIESGEADIVSVGMDMADGREGYAQDFIRKGYYEDLKGYLDSPEGEALWEWYTKMEWERSETDGKNYVLPFQGAVFGSSFFAFNKEYVTEDMLAEFTGTPEELEALLNSLELPAGVHGILTGMSFSDVAILCGMVAEDGVFYDLETGIAENPFENEDYYRHMKKLNELYLNGVIKEFGGMDALTKEQDAVRNGNYVVWIDSRRNEFYEEVQDGFITVPMQFSIVNALSTCNGINKYSDSKEAALQLLTLLHTEADYANMLIFGEEGADYYLQNGYVYKPDGTPYNKSWGDLGLGLYDVVLPGKNDFIKSNRREFKNNHYASEYYLESAILGFQPDFTVFPAGVPAAVSVLTDYGAIWKETDFDVAWKQAQQAFKDGGGEEMIIELNKQVAEWMSLYR